jgi:type I restriction-modification system DNA methylase subunit
MAPKEIIDLVARFEQNRDQYTSGNYNEAQLRQEFLNPFFAALGWDVENRQGYAEAYKEVIHEDAIKIGTATKAPDYSFRIGGTRKYFVEAKNPSVNLKEDITPAYQLRRYAWSAKLPLSILSDFEELAIYDCRTKPLKTDKASVGRIRFLTFREYIAEWDTIASVFSKEAVLKGSFDKYAESTRAKKGTAEVDDAFLKEIESWRELLAKNIALRNSKLTQRELNFAVQRTIDRIIFLRICEDRGIETYARLLSLVNGERVYRRLYEQFYRADEKYNSGLFHFDREKGRPEQPDELTPKLHIDDKALKEIIGNLYYPDCPYEFSVLPADILGQVYEQFLGKVIRLTAGHQAKVEDKPEVKKAGGVYYTPTYIVDYIVKNTVGKLLNPDFSEAVPEEANVILNEAKRSEESAHRVSQRVSKQHRTKPVTPKEASRLRILDPACGSGSFLIGAYQYLLDWHRDWYVKNDPTKYISGRSAALFKGPGGDWRLTTAERKRILLNNIYGVDIDSQAVEVTKLSLLLKVLEGENEQTISQQLKMFHERALPDLGNNIKCGNSLIGPDFYEGKQLSLLEDEERMRINVFDWKKEFKEIMDGGGFDAVIGNPPYVRQEGLGKEFKKYSERKFSAFSGTADLYVYFVEQAHRVLRKRNGLFGMICSNKFMRANYGKPLRDFLTERTKIREIIDFGELPVFENAATFPAIFLTENAVSPKQRFRYAAIKKLDFLSLPEEVESTANSLDERSLKGDNWTLASMNEVLLIEKLRQTSIPLSEYVREDIYFGIKTGLNDAFVIDEKSRKRLIGEDKRNVDFIKPFVVGDDIRKYVVNFKNRFLILIPKGWTKSEKPEDRNAWDWFRKEYKSLAKHLEPHEIAAEKRLDKGDYWWELRACDYYDKFKVPKIVYPDIAKESRIAFDNDGLYLANTIYFIPTDDKYLLALLNSRVLFKFFKRTAAVLGDADKGGRLRWFRQDVLKLPIRAIDFSNAADKSRHDKMVQLVEQMLSLHKQLPAARTEHEKEVLQRQIEVTDKQIDQLVYELYGLTDEEIKIVEGKE